MNTRFKTNFDCFIKCKSLSAYLLIFGAFISLAAHASCQPFVVESSHGDGGFRFMHDVKNFHHVASDSKYEAVICDRRSFQIELAKKDPAASVKFGIDGRFFEFNQGDLGDKNLKGWYRKYIDISF